MLQMQFTWTAVIVQAISDVGILLNLTNGYARANRVNGSRRHENGIARFNGRQSSSISISPERADSSMRSAVMCSLKPPPLRPQVRPPRRTRPPSFPNFGDVCAHNHHAGGPERITAPL